MLTVVDRLRWLAGVLWSDQVDAAACVVAMVKVVGGGGARVQRRREEGDGDEQARGKVKRDPWPYL